MSEKSRRGFASMSTEKQREIASKGGKAAHAKGTAHEFTADEAREAGRKGGKAAHARGTAHRFTQEEARVAGRKGGEAVSQNREHMAEIGREGGRTSRSSHEGPETHEAAMDSRNPNATKLTTHAVEYPEGYFAPLM